jgi:hypothetical protein
MAKKKRRADEFDDDEIVELTAIIGGLTQAVQENDRSAMDWVVSELLGLLGYEEQITYRRPI